MRQGRWLWAVAALLLVVAAVRVACAMGHRDGHVPSELYRSYENNPHIQAAYMEDYQLGDSLVIAVTILEATDSTGWLQLREDFGFPVLSPEIEKKTAEHNSVTYKKAKKGDPGAGADTVCRTNTDWLVIEHRTMTFYLFHIETESQFDYIFKTFTQKIHQT